MTPRVTADDVGRFFVDPNGDVWRMVGFADQPTATFDRLERPETVQEQGFTPCRIKGVVVSSQQFADLGLQRLLPEDEG